MPIVINTIRYITDIGRIYIKGYLYPISYPKIAKKDIISSKKGYVQCLLYYMKQHIRKPPCTLIVMYCRELPPYKARDIF
jgi:hypothetical protein